MQIKTTRNTFPTRQKDDNYHSFGGHESSSTLTTAMNNFSISKADTNATASETQHSPKYEAPHRQKDNVAEIKKELEEKHEAEMDLLREAINNMEEKLHCGKEKRKEMRALYNIGLAIRTRWMVSRMDFSPLSSAELKERGNDVAHGPMPIADAYLLSHSSMAEHRSILLPQYRDFYGVAPEVVIAHSDFPSFVLALRIHGSFKMYLPQGLNSARGLHFQNLQHRIAELISKVYPQKLLKSDVEWHADPNLYKELQELHGIELQYHEDYKE